MLNRLKTGKRGQLLILCVYFYKNLCIFLFTITFLTFLNKNVPKKPPQKAYIKDNTSALYILKGGRK